MDPTTRRLTAIALALTVVATVYAVKGDLIQAGISIAGVAACLLWGFWPDIRRRRFSGALRPPDGFDLEEAIPIREGEDYGFRIALRPRWRFIVLKLRFRYDAPLTRFRADLILGSGTSGPLIPEMQVPLASARSIETHAIYTSFHLALDPTVKLVFEFLGPGLVNVIEIERVSVPPDLDLK